MFWGLVGPTTESTIPSLCYWGASNDVYDAHIAIGFAGERPWSLTVFTFSTEYNLRKTRVEPTDQVYQNSRILIMSKYFVVNIWPFGFGTGTKCDVLCKVISLYVQKHKLNHEKKSYIMSKWPWFQLKNTFLFFSSPYTQPSLYNISVPPRNI